MCDPQTDIITVTATGSFNGGNSTISLFEVVGLFGFGRVEGPAGGPLTYSFPADGASHVFFIADNVISANSGCRHSTVSVDGSSCALPPCSIDITGLSGTPTCQSDGTYSVDVLVDYSNSPGGDIQIGITVGSVAYGGLLNTTAGASVTGAVVTVTGLPSNGATSLEINGSFLDEPDCSDIETVVFTDPACPQPQCPPNLATPTVSSACNDNGTQSLPDDDFVLVTVTGNTDGRGDYEILVDGAALSPSIQASDGEGVTFSLSADGTSAAISIGLVDDPLSSCSPSAAVNVSLATCSPDPPCDITFSSTIQEGACDNGGTPGDSSDDRTAFNIPANTVTITNGGTTYDVLVNGTPVVSFVDPTTIATFTIPNDGRQQFVSIRASDAPECELDINSFSTAGICCTEPSATTTTIEGACNVAPVNDAMISLTSISGGDRVAINQGSNFIGGPDYSAAIDLSGGTMHDFTGLMHSTQYATRVYNGSDLCFVEYIITTPAFNPIDTTDITETICSNETHSFNNQTLNTTGVYLDTLSQTNSCDSIIRLTLSVNPVDTTDIAETICSNETHSFNNQTLNTTGVYLDTLSQTNSCDSIIRLTLSVNPVDTTDITETICSNETHSFNNQDLMTAGVYLDTLSQSNSCDSIIRLTLSVNPVDTTDITETICSNETHSFNNQDLMTAGVYLDTLSQTNSCDSIIRLTLSVNPVDTTDIAETICSNETHSFNNQTLNTTGVYLDTLSQTNSCDSIIRLTLSVNPVDTTDIAETICSNETHSFNNQNFKYHRGIFRYFKSEQ